MPHLFILLRHTGELLTVPGDNALKQRLLFTVFSLTVWPLAAAVAEPQPLKGAIMKERLPGATIEIDTPLGTKIPMRFGGDGLVTGEAGVLGTYLGSSKDRGRWWVDADRLCIKWFRWFESQPRCMDIRLDGTRVFWRKEDGESGTATLAEAPKQAPAKTTAAAVKPAAPAAKAAPKIEAAQTGTIPAEAPDTPPAPEVAEAPAASEPASHPVPETAGNIQAAAAVPSIVEQAAALAARFAAPSNGKAAAIESQRMSVGAVTTEPVILNPTPDAPAPEDNAAITGSPVETAALEPEQQAAQDAEPIVTSAIETAAAPTPAAPAANEQPPQTATPATKKPVQRAEKKPAPRQPSFRVARVADNDMLNIRSGPSEYTSIVGIISPSGRGVRVTGDCRGDWCPIRHGATAGWVNRYYLAEDIQR